MERLREEGGMEGGEREREREREREKLAITAHRSPYDNYHFNIHHD